MVEEGQRQRQQDRHKRTGHPKQQRIRQAFPVKRVAEDGEEKAEGEGAIVWVHESLLEYAGGWVKKAHGQQ